MDCNKQHAADEAGDGNSQFFLPTLVFLLGFLLCKQGLNVSIYHRNVVGPFCLILNLCRHLMRSKSPSEDPMEQVGACTPQARRVLQNLTVSFADGFEVC